MARMRIAVLCGMLSLLLAAGGCANCPWSKGAKTDELAQVKAELAETKTDLAKTEEQLGDVHADWRKLVRELKAIRAQAGKESTEKEILSAKLSKAKGGMAAMKTQLDRTVRRAKKAENAVRKAEQAGKQAKADAAREKKKAATLKGQVELLEAKVKQLEKTLAEVRAKAALDRGPIKPD